MGEADQPRGRVNHGAVANNQENSRRRSPAGLLPRSRSGSTSWSQTTSGRSRAPQRGHARQLGQRLVAAVGRITGCSRAAHSRQAAVQLEDSLAAGRLVQAIDTLGDQGKPIDRPKRSSSATRALMAWVGQ